MRYEWKRLTGFIVIALFMVNCAVAVGAQTGTAGNPISSGNALQEQSHKARENFLRKDFRAAAFEIRQAVAFLESEEAKASKEAKQDLRESVQELRALADRVEKKAVTAEKELDDSFARAEHALARYYHAKASESWAKKEASQAGQYLRAAAVHLENALSPVGRRMEETSKEVIEEAKDIGEKVEKGVGLSLKKSLEVMGREITESAYRMPFSKSAGGDSVRVAEKSTGAVNLSAAIMNVAKESMSKVVYIEVTESRVVQNPFLPFGNDPFFRRFFGTPKMPRKFKQETKGLGSGMIIDAQGYILTNNHVAGGASKIQVTLADGNQYPATLVGADPKTDLAVIRISAKESLPYVVFGNSDEVQVGEWVVAIGAPRALEKSVTQGIISAKHRTGISDPNTYQDYLQTDAAVNPGNSGGPLLNLYGQVIGVNAAIASSSGGFEGIAFTIPSNMAVYIANALIAHGKVERGWLGVSTRNLIPGLAKAVHVEQLTGALLVDVVKGGPGEKAGLKKNDVVVAYGGKAIPDSATLRNEVAQTKIGEQVTLTVLRDGKKEEVTVTIGNLEGAAQILSAVVKERLGAEVRLPTPKEVEQYGLNPNQGVVIAWLESKGPLAAAGFEVGDLIVAVNEQPVEGMDSFIGLISDLPPGRRASLAALDHRTGTVVTIFVVVK